MHNADRHLNIAMIAAVDLPEGGGETTRLKTLVYALKEAGHSVRILLENTSGNVDEKLLTTKGEINSIPFEYILGDTVPLKGSDFFLAKAKVARLFRKRLNELNSEQKIDVIWFNMLAAHTIWPLTSWAKKRGIKIIHSYEDERIKGRGIKRRLIYANQWIADKYFSRMADAIVVISEYLKKKYEQLTLGKVPVVIIPTVVEEGKWFAGPMPEHSIPVLLYYGSFYGFDEIEKMIDAVEILRQKEVHVKLWLAGYNRKKPEYMNAISEYINKKDLSEWVSLKGFTLHDKLMDYIRQSDILIGLRKDDPWSSTGLSTKLSEYLATGRPVIATAVGDNLKYLIHKTSAILLAPDCQANVLTEAIAMLINDRLLREKIGEAGRNVALAQFELKVIARKLNDLLAII